MLLTIKESTDIIDTKPLSEANEGYTHKRNRICLSALTKYLERYIQDIHNGYHQRLEMLEVKFGLEERFQFFWFTFITSVYYFVHIKF